jgi:hypothetical protein
MSSTAVIKKGRAITRIYGLVEIGAGAADLTDKVLEVKLSVPGGSVVEVATGTVQPQTGATLGYYYIEVTAANLTALGNPTQITMVVNFYNADNSVFLWGRATLPVEL